MSSDVTHLTVDGDPVVVPAREPLSPEKVFDFVVAEYRIELERVHTIYGRCQIVFAGTVAVATGLWVIRREYMDTAQPPGHLPPGPVAWLVCVCGLFAGASFFSLLMAVKQRSLSTFGELKGNMAVLLNSSDAGDGVLEVMQALCARHRENVEVVRKREAWIGRGQDLLTVAAGCCFSLGLGLVVR